MSFYLVIDAKTSGCSYMRDDLLCIGAAIVSISEVIVKEKFLIYINNGRPINWSDSWLKNQQLLDKMLSLVADGYEPKVAMEKFVKWSKSMIKKYDPIVIADLAKFDFGWINYYLSVYKPGGHSSVCQVLGGSGRPIRDINSFYLGILRNAHVGESADKRVCGLLNIIYLNPTEEQHNPLNGAIITGLRAAYVTNELKRQKSPPEKINKTKSTSKNDILDYLAMAVDQSIHS